MQISSLRSILILPLVLFFGNLPLHSEVSLDPFGIAVALEADAEETQEMTLANDGDIDVSFEIGFAQPEEGGRLNRGPRRDDFGDVIEFYDLPNRGWCGMAWNDEDIMVADWDNHRIHFWNVEEEEIDNGFAVNYAPWGLAYDGEAYWVALDNPTQLRRIDREGDEFATINLGYVPAGVAWDGENLWTYPYYPRNQWILRQITVEGEVLVEIDCADIEGRDSFALTWIPEHDSGHLWVISEGATLMQWDVDLENEEVEVVQDVDYNHPGGTYGITHDGENIWYSVYAGGGAGWGFGVVDDGIAEPRWLLAEPREGVIPANDVETFELQFNSAELEAGIYQMQTIIELAEAENERDELGQSQIEISTVMSVETDVAALTGTITDDDNDEPMEDVCVELDRYIITRYSDEEGNYGFTNLPLGDYIVTFTATDYLPTTEEITLDDGDAELNVELLHSECVPHPEFLESALEPDLTGSQLNHRKQRQRSANLPR